jgi:NAD(P)-dependent dehydrogenase (short-subunit alcohol dehydrogenase family)
MTSAARVALVTGGNSGIGAGIARRLAHRGDAVAVVGRRGALCDAIAASITAAGGDCLAIEADLADPAAPGRIVDQVRERWGRLDVLVNDAAIIKNLPVPELTVEVMDAHYAVNVRAPFLLVKAALPLLTASDSASIVNISSSSGSLSIPGQSAYGFTKAAIEYMTRSYAAELAPMGIRVNCIAPGPIDTPIHLTWAADMETAYRALRDATPLGLIGQPDDIARWVDYLSAPDEHYVTGAVLHIDAGQTLNGWASAIADAAGDTERATTGDASERARP